MRRNDSIMDREVRGEWRRYSGVFSKSQPFLLAEVGLEADGHFTLKHDFFPHKETQMAFQIKYTKLFLFPKYVLFLEMKTINNF